MHRQGTGNVMQIDSNYRFFKSYRSESAYMYAAGKLCIVHWQAQT